MDTLAMHRTLTDAGFPPGQADAVVKVMQGGVVTKRELGAAVAELRYEISASRAVERAGRDDAAEGLHAACRSLAVDQRALFDRLHRKLNLLLALFVLAVLAPAATRLILGS